MYYLFHCCPSLTWCTLLSNFMGESREWTKSYNSRMEQRPESHFAQHTTMPNPFPGLVEVSGGQRVPEPRTQFNKNTSLAGGKEGGTQAEVSAWESYLVGTLGHFDAPLMSDTQEHHCHTQQLSSYSCHSPPQVKGTFQPLLQLDIGM